VLKFKRKFRRLKVKQHNACVLKSSEILVHRSQGAIRSHICTVWIVQIEMGRKQAD